MKSEFCCGKSDQESTVIVIGGFISAESAAGEATMDDNEAAFRIGFYLNGFKVTSAFGCTVTGINIDME